jgi:hypothetical protein
MLRTGTATFPAFRWSVVGIDDLEIVASSGGFGTREVHRLGERWCAVLA